MRKTSQFRFWAAAAVLGVLAGYLAAGGTFGRTSGIVIDFGIDPREFEGVEVEIDGQVAGRLVREGEAARTAFRVGRGEHTVRLRHPGYGSAVRTVVTEPGEESVLLVVEFAQMAGRGGIPEVVVTLR